MRTFDPRYDAIFDEPGGEPGLFGRLDASESDISPVPFSGDMGVSARSARQAVRALAASAGYAAHTLIEWSSSDAPGAPPAGQPALCYAALLPNTAADDMPLGIGASAAEALGDLLWALGAPGLLAALAVDGPESVWDDALASDLAEDLASELARSGLW